VLRVECYDKRKSTRPFQGPCAAGCLMNTKTILIADDNNFIRRLVCAALQPLGCTLAEAVDGEETLRMIEDRRPDLVLLDLVMPKLNGFEVLERLRSSPDTSDLTVVMLTTAASEGDLAQGRRHGVADYVIKPFDTSELRETVARLL